MRDFKLYLFLLTIIGCNTRPSAQISSENQENISVEDTFSRYKSITADTSFKFQKSDSIPQDAFNLLADTSINELILNDASSVLKKFGSLAKLIDWQEESAYVINKDNSQLLSLHHANGGYKDEYDIITVEYLDKKLLSDQFLHTSIDIFSTENAVQLGISEEEFKHIFSNIKWEGRLEGEKKVYSFHNEYMTYLAEYIFVNNKLIQFSFGYDHS